MFIEEVAEIAAVDSEHSGRSGFHAFGHEQGFQDDLSLNDLKTSFQGAVKRRFESEFVEQAPNTKTPLLLKNDNVFDRILQFPHVSRPRVIHDQRERVEVDVDDLLAQRRRVALQEMADEQWDVFAPLSKRRQADREGVEPV